VESDASGWAVIIEDNGRGLGFTGRLSPDDPEFERRAPHVIRERAVALGGSLTLDSSSDGTRLEISFPPLEDRQG
jgi:signal transduction histidine kinase